MSTGLILAKARVDTLLEFLNKKPGPTSTALLSPLAHLVLRDEVWMGDSFAKGMPPDWSPCDVPFLGHQVLAIVALTIMPSTTGPSLVLHMKPFLFTFSQMPQRGGWSKATQCHATPVREVAVLYKCQASSSVAWPPSKPSSDTRRELSCFRE